MNDMLRDTLGRLLGRRPPVLQVGAICRDVSSGRVLLITSRGTGRWIIPKGWPMSGISAAGAALQEAWEEAGVRGSIGQKPLGRYGYKKWQESGFSIYVHVHVYLVEVERLEEEFPERDERVRKWHSPVEAADLVEEDGLKELLLTLDA